MHLRWTWGAVLGIILMTLACGGSGAEARARSCFEALSQGNMDVTMQCMASDRRERFADAMKQRSEQLKGCHTQVTSAQVKEKGQRAEVLLKFKEPCGEPPSDANGRKVTGVGIGLTKENGTYYVTQFERMVE